MEGLISIPFTGQAIINTVLAGVKHKINPSPYIKKLYMALEIMIKGDLDSALETFDEAQKMHQHPYEALYYLGEIYKSKGLNNEALSHYEQAYTHNPKHYKTLRDLSALYYQQKNYKMAYEFNVQMAQSYPIPPERIPELIRLSIINQKYPDIINYLKIFDSLKSPNDELKNSLAAGLAILGKHFFILNENDNACEALKRAFTYSNGKYEVLKNISKTFQDMNKSEVLLNAFDNIDLSQWPDNAEGIYFQTLNLVSKDDGAVINYAEKLLKRKIYDVVIYKGMIERGIKIKRKIGVIEGQVFEAIKNFPAHKDEFEELLAEAKKELAS